MKKNIIYIISAVIVILGIGVAAFLLIVKPSTKYTKKYQTATIDPKAVPPKIEGFMTIKDAVVTENTTTDSVDGKNITYKFYVDAPIPAEQLKKAYVSNLRFNKWEVAEPSPDSILATKPSKTLNVTFTNDKNKINISAKYFEKK